MKKNMVGWFEIYVDNMDRAKSFYETLFSISLENLSVDEFEMWMFPWQDGGAGAGGALTKMEGMKGGSGGTVVYFMCEDCSVEEKKAVTIGGHVIQSKIAIGENGFAAMIKDTEGNVIGLHSMK